MQWCRFRGQKETPDTMHMKSILVFFWFLNGPWPKKGKKQYEVLEETFRSQASFLS